jgi:hypothetical protein
MSKIDLKKEHKALYRPAAGKIVEIDVPAFDYLMIDGGGGPEAPAYAQAVEALFTVSYLAKFKIKRSDEGVDYAVMPLEGLWWAHDMSAFIEGDRDAWQWTMMIMQPGFVAEHVIEEAIEDARVKKDLPAIDKMRFERFHEGRAAQTLHVGPFSEEGPTIARLHEYIGQRAALSGKHHEIYLSDVRRAAPKNWKTILRQPMR